MKKLRICSTFNLCYRTKADLCGYIREGLDFYKNNGFDAADFDMDLADFSKAGWQADFEQAVSISDEVGVKFEVCHLPYLYGGELAVPEFMVRFDEKMHKAIDAAVMLGVDHAVLHPDLGTVLMKGFNETQQYDLAMGHLAPYAEHAAKVGLSIALENMRVIPGMRLTRRYGQSPEDVCKLADALGFGVCWDFGHANISAIKQSEGLAYVGKRLKVIHINDNTSADDDHVAPFMGDIDWRDAMHGLALCGFDGLMNYEVKVNKQPASTRVSFAKHLVDVANELMTYIE